VSTMSGHCQRGNGDRQTEIGAVYIAIGSQAQAEAKKSIASLKQYNPDLPVVVISECDKPEFTDKQKSRYFKTLLPLLVKFDGVLYLDADTRIHGNILTGFELLDDWDLAIVPSTNQDGNVFEHIKNGEKLLTIDELGYIPLQLQAGVMFFDRLKCAELFECWHQEWLRFKDQDQAALIRALAQVPARVWLLGRDWNDGKLIEHLFGRCR